MTVPQPIELDVACGTTNHRATWHREVMACVEPQAFVLALQEWVAAYLQAAEDACRPKASTPVEDTPPEIAPVPSGAAGEVVSGEGAAASSRAAAPEPRPRRPAVQLSRSQARVAERLKQRGVDAA